ncbi:MAG: hypothetical protein IPJ75_19750 [Ignavibacteriales bacterium]|nr:hypothetical protein [Ignavibacteriales bacterium]
MKLYLLLSLILVGGLFAQMPDKYVVLVIIDGARYSETLGDTAGTYTPNMKRLALEGAVIDSFFNNGATVTSRGVPAIWSGSWSTPKDTFTTVLIHNMPLFQHFGNISGRNINRTQPKLCTS